MPVSFELKKVNLDLSKSKAQTAKKYVVLDIGLTVYENILGKRRKTKTFDS